jgi:hypothetical protein
MESLTCGPWHVKVDREATVRAHAAMRSGGAEECRCGPCKNFAAQRPIEYPSGFLDLLSRLGIDRNREIEVYAFESERADGLEYCGWFYFVGFVEADPTEPDRANGPYPYAFRYYLKNGPAYAVEQFANLPVSRVKFQFLCLPWTKGFSPATPPG